MAGDSLKPSKLMRRLRKGQKPKDLTLEDALSHYHEVRDSWLKESGRAQTRELLEHHKPAEGWGVTHGVLLGIGPLADEVRHRYGIAAAGESDDEDYDQMTQAEQDKSVLSTANRFAALTTNETGAGDTGTPSRQPDDELHAASDSADDILRWGSYGSLLQLVQFLDIVEYLTPEGQTKIPLYAQELDWDVLELQVLHSLGFKIVWHPEAFTLIKRGCFAFLPHAAVDATIMGRCRHLLPTIRLSDCVAKAIVCHEHNLIAAKRNGRPREWRAPVTPRNMLKHYPGVVARMRKFEETRMEVEMPRPEDVKPEFDDEYWFQFEKPGLPALGEVDGCAACAESLTKRYR